MPKYEVVIPISGRETWIVEAGSEDEALVKAQNGKGECTEHETDFDDRSDERSVNIIE